MQTPNCIISWDDVPIIFDIPFCCVLIGKSYDCIKKCVKNKKFPHLNLAANGDLTRPK